MIVRGYELQRNFECTQASKCVLTTLKVSNQGCELHAFSVVNV